jgi:hypothetical protein
MIQELNKLISDFIEIPNINVKYSIGNAISDLCDPKNYEIYIHIDTLNTIPSKINQSNQVISFDKLDTVYRIVADTLQTSLSVSDMLPNIKIEIFNIIEDMYLENPVAYIYIKPNGVK